MQAQHNYLRSCMPTHIVGCALLTRLRSLLVQHTEAEYRTSLYLYSYC